jgi:hypothetical protein
MSAARQTTKQVSEYSPEELAELGKKAIERKMAQKVKAQATLKQTREYVKRKKQFVNSAEQVSKNMAKYLLALKEVRNESMKLNREAGKTRFEVPTFVAMQHRIDSFVKELRDASKPEEQKAEETEEEETMITA